MLLSNRVRLGKLAEIFQMAISNADYLMKIVTFLLIHNSLKLVSENLIDNISALGHKLATNHDLSQWWFSWLMHLMHTSSEHIRLKIHLYITMQCEQLLEQHLKHIHDHGIKLQMLWFVKKSRVQYCGIYNAMLYYLLYYVVQLTSME